MVEFTIDAVTVGQFVLTAVLPLLVGLVTTRLTHSGLKATLLAALTLVASLLAEAVRAWQDGVAYDLGNGLFLALPAFAAAVSLHYGLYKPTGAAEAVMTHGITANGTRYDREGHAL